LHTQVQASVYRKIAWRLLPFLLLCYVFAQLTRFNISFAKQQFTDDLEINDAVFGVAASLFYVGCIVFQVPAGIFTSRFGVRAALLCMMFAWGAAGTLMAFARHGGDIYALRFVLGAFQGSFFPTVILYLSCWFPDRLRGRINALFTSALPLGSIVAGPLAGVIMAGMDDFHGLRGWQWLFIVEGLPVILLAIAAYRLLTNRPESAAWLKDNERHIVLADARAGRMVNRSTDTPLHLRKVLPEAGTVLFGFIYFGYFCALNALNLWGPSLLTMSSLERISSVGWISGLSALVAAIGMLLIGVSSDRLMERRWHIGLSGIASAACLLLLPLASSSIAATASLIAVAGVGLYAILGLFWTIPTAHLKLENRASGLAFINMCGLCGGIVSPTLVGWLKVWTGSLYVGVGAIAILLALSMMALLAFVPSRAGREGG